MQGVGRQAETVVVVVVVVVVVAVAVAAVVVAAIHVCARSIYNTGLPQLLFYSSPLHILFVVVVAELRQEHRPMQEHISAGPRAQIR